MPLNSSSDSEYEREGASDCPRGNGVDGLSATDCPVTGGAGAAAGRQSFSIREGLTRGGGAAAFDFRFFATAARARNQVCLAVFSVAGLPVRSVRPNSAISIQNVTQSIFSPSHLSTMSSWRLAIQWKRLERSLFRATVLSIALVSRFRLAMRKTLPHNFENGRLLRITKS